MLVKEFAGYGGCYRRNNQEWQRILEKCCRTYQLRSGRSGPCQTSIPRQQEFVSKLLSYVYFGTFSWGEEWILRRGTENFSNLSTAASTLSPYLLN